MDNRKLDALVRVVVNGRSVFLNLKEGRLRLFSHSLGK